jgi:hypothetical protein
MLRPQGVITRTMIEGWGGSANKKEAGA